jgi:hypothetical protein
MEQLIRFRIANGSRFRFADGDFAEGTVEGGELFVEMTRTSHELGPLGSIRDELFRRLDAGEEPLVRLDGERYEFVDEKKAATAEPADMINAPPHYRRGGVEVIDAIEAWGLGYRLGNVVKYIARAGHKGSRREDLEKARWYLSREIERS